MAKKLHQYFNLQEPVKCINCSTDIADIHKCNVLIDTEAIKEQPYEVDIDEKDVKYFCLDCCEKLKI